MVDNVQCRLLRKLTQCCVYCVSSPLKAAWHMPCANRPPAREPRAAMARRLDAASFKVSQGKRESSLGTGSFGWPRMRQ